jgi:membrane protein
MTTTAAPGAPRSTGPRRYLANLVALFRRTLEKFNADRVPQMASAFAYLTIFSLAPMLFIIIAIIGAVIGPVSARAQVLNFLQSVVGPESTKFVAGLMDGITRPGAGVLATALGALTLFLGAIGIFGQIKFALRVIWNVPAPPSRGGLGDILYFIRDQLASGALVILTGLLMLGSLILSTASSAALNTANDLVEGVVMFSPLLNTIGSFALLTLLFGAMNRYLPGLRIHWSDVLPGSFLTALLFELARWLVGLYLARASLASAYGAAGSLVLLLLWVNYVGQILFFGAEFTAVYASMYGSLRGTKKAEEAITGKDTVVSLEHPEHESNLPEEDLQAMQEAIPEPEAH